MLDLKKRDIKEIEKDYRKALKPDWKLWSISKTDKKLKKPYPDVYKKYAGGDIVELEKEFDDELITIMDKRQSRRKYSEKPLTLSELSYMLYSVGNMHSEGNGWSKRMIPTGGATHSLETYVVVVNVEGVKKGLYRYMPDTGNIEFVKDVDLDKFNEAIYKQVRGSGAVIVWSSLPYRAEYKYSFAAHKMIAIEAGHACQNLYLAVEKLELGTVAICCYYQDLLDKTLGFDGENEFAIYVATVGNNKN